MWVAPFPPLIYIKLASDLSTFFLGSLFLILAAM